MKAKNIVVEREYSDNEENLDKIAEALKIFLKKLEEHVNSIKVS